MIQALWIALVKATKDSGYRSDTNTFAQFSHIYTKSTQLPYDDGKETWALSTKDDLKNWFTHSMSKDKTNQYFEQAAHI